MRNLKEFALPENVEQFWEKKSKYGPRARVIAGGTEIVSEPPEDVECLIDVRNLIPSGIEEDEDFVTLGAGATMEILANSDLVSNFANGMLRDAARQGWPVAVRSAATVGGNVAGGDPFADTPPVFLALGADFVLETVSGPKVVPVDEFFLDYRKTAAEGALLMKIRIPRRRPNSRGAFLKVAPAAVDKAMVNIGIFAEIEEGRCVDVRVAVGALTRIPHRVTSVESLIMDELLTEELVDEAAENVAANVEPMLDMRAPAEHRKTLLSALFKRAVRSLAQAG